MTVSESAEGSMTAIKYHVAISCILYIQKLRYFYISESCDHSFTSKIRFWNVNKFGHINIINGVL